MIFDKTINDVIDYTGLKYEYVIKCIKELDKILKPYIQRGDKNSLIFDSNALKIFDRVKQLKEGKQSISSIKVQLESELNKTPQDAQNSISNLIKDTQNMQESELTKLLINKLEESNKKNFEALEKNLQSKDQVIEVQKRENQELKNQILFITDGRTYDEIRLEQQNKEQELFRLKQQAESASKETEEIKTKVFEKTEELEKIKMKEQKRQEILKELQSLEGKWFARKKRQELFTQFQNLSQI